jgi:hypothetical protein
MSKGKKIVFLKSNENCQDLIYFESNVINAAYNYQVEVGNWGSTFDTANKAYLPKVRFYDNTKHTVVVDLYSENFNIYLSGISND